MANQLIIDLYGCDSQILDDTAKIQQIATALIESIHSKIIEEHIHKFKPIGISYFAIISSSHFSVHTWPENTYAAIDLFSCEDFDSDKVIADLKHYFVAQKVESKLIERRISDR